MDRSEEGIPPLCLLQHLPCLAIGLLVIAMPVPSWGRNAAAMPRSKPAMIRPWDAAVKEASVRFALPHAWIHAVIGVESGGNPGARSPKGAMGLMQLMPATWSAISLRERLGQDPFDLRANVLAGAAYLRSMIDRFGDLSSALAAYNAGPGRVDDWRLHGHVLPAETLAYVTRLSRQLRLGAPGLTGSATLGGRAKAADWRVASLFSPARREEQNVSDHGPDDTSPQAAMRSDQSDLPDLFVAVSQRSEP